uniref:SLC41A/MgtE integral membrane domain-containing protein n=1 Tax=Timema bartmani TaxID=61472 RepID=A0A7R9F7C9_9NEOP|nr:unnamed protein product [Timema bartmani]
MARRGDTNDLGGMSHEKLCSTLDAISEDQAKDSDIGEDSDAEDYSIIPESVSSLNDSIRSTSASEEGMTAMVAFPDLSREDENGAYTSSGVPKIVAPYLATTDEDLEKIKNMYDDAPPTPIHDSISSTRSSITLISVISIPDPTDIISTTSIQPRKEHWWNVMIEVALPFLLGGVGTIAAGIILGSVENLRQSGTNFSSIMISDLYNILDARKHTHCESVTLKFIFYFIVGGQI